MKLLEQIRLVLADDCAFDIAMGIVKHYEETRPILPGMHVTITRVPEAADRYVKVGMSGWVESSPEVVDTGKLVQVRIGRMLFWWDVKDLEEKST